MNFLKDFNQRLNLELVNSETVRIRALLYIVGSGIVIGAILWLLIPEKVAEVFHNPSTIWMLLESSLLLFVFELFVLRQIRKVKNEGKPFPQKIRYLGVFVEITFPSAVILLVAVTESSYHYLDSPPFLFYFLFIILSPLRLDFYLSLFTGAVAFIEYFFISIWIVNTYLPEGEIGQARLLSFHIEKSLLLFVGGLLAGFVAREIHQKIKHSVEAERERNEVKMLFGQQVSKAVMDELIEHKDLSAESRKLDVSIMFMDIRNFTPFAETRTPEEIIAFQNAIFSPIIEIIHRYDGIINQIMGDGFMATFGAPVSSVNHCEQATHAAIESVEQIKALVNEGKIPATRIGIGIHTGDVVAGNIGNMIRQQYSITGTTVITAARIEQLNKKYDTQLIISKDAYERVNGLQKDFEYLCSEQLKGQANQIEMYRYKES